MSKRDINADLVDWASPSIQVGTPTMVLLPARNYRFKILEGEHIITIPRKGTYHGLDDKYFAKDDGEFCLLDSEKSIMYLPAITKVLFATKKYPDLKGNQLFAPLALRFNEDTVDVLGQVIEMLQSRNNNDEDTVTV